MGETKVSLRILVNDQTLNTTIQEKLASFPFIEFKQESSNLSIEFDNLNSKNFILKHLIIITWIVWRLRQHGN